MKFLEETINQPIEENYELEQMEEREYVNGIAKDGSTESQPNFNRDVGILAHTFRQFVQLIKKLKLLFLPIIYLVAWFFS